MKFDEFDQYSENMLLGQYEISEIISHGLMKGEVREDFLISTLEACSEPKPMLVKGTISDGTNDAGQLDIVLCRPNSHLRKMGSQCFIEKNDSLCVIEVKGNCTGEDLKRAEAKAIKIQRLQGNQPPLFGVICYKVALKEKTIMKRFGFSFDQETSTYFDLATIGGFPEAIWEGLEYPTSIFSSRLKKTRRCFCASTRLCQVSQGSSELTVCH
jgi:hypothetical protein